MNERQRRLILILGLAALSACTSTVMTRKEGPATPATRDGKPAAEAEHKPASTNAPTQQSAAKPKTTAAHTAKEIQALAERLKNHPATLYSLARDAYTLYVGGVLTASTQGAEGGLTLTPDDGRQTTCRYDARGRLVRTKKAKGEADDPALCERLLTTLDKMLGAE